MPFVVDGKPNPHFPTDRPIWLFFDEVTSASQGVFAVLYQLTLGRAVNEHKLMDNVYVVLAGNRESDRGVVNRMPTPLSNRLTHVEAGIDRDAWVYDFAIPNEVHPVGIAFVQMDKAHLYNFDPASGEKAFATPRSMAKAFKYFADDKMDDLIKQAMIHGAIGSGMASQFLGFAEVWKDIIPPKQVLKDPEGTPVPDETKLSTRWAMAVAISGEMDADTAGAFHTYLKRLGAEYVTTAWSMAVRRDQKAEERGKPNPKPVEQSDAFMDFAEDYRVLWKRD